MLETEEKDNLCPSSLLKQERALENPNQASIKAYVSLLLWIPAEDTCLHLIWEGRAS